MGFRRRRRRVIATARPTADTPFAVVGPIPPTRQPPTSAAEPGELPGRPPAADPASSCLVPAAPEGLLPAAPESLVPALPPAFDGEEQSGNFSGWLFDGSSLNPL